MKINLEGYELEGTPAEMLQLLDLLADEVAAVEKAAPDPDRGGTVAKPKTGPKQKKVDWAKAAALRKAGWSYKKIGDELGVADVTVAAHLNK